MVIFKSLQIKAGIFHPKEHNIPEPQNQYENLTINAISLLYPVFIWFIIIKKSSINGNCGEDKI